MELKQILLQTHRTDVIRGDDMKELKHQNFQQLNMIIFE